MTVKYKIIKTAQPGVKGGGTYKYYPRIHSRTKIGLDQLAIHISNRGTLTRSDVYATLISMLEVIPELLLDNYTIDMGGMGIFSLHINGRPSDTPEEVNESKIKNVNIAYRPGKEIKTKIGHAKFTIR